MRDFLRPYQRHMIDLDIYRSGKKINTVKGLKNHEDSGRKMFDFYPETDIKVGDVIVEPITNLQYYIYDIDITSINGQVAKKKAYFHTEAEHNAESQQSVTFNINNPKNSIVGTQQTATMTNGYSINDITKLIENHNSDDKELLKEMVCMLEKTISEKEPVKKGFLSKFTDVMSRNEWITTPIATLFLEKFLM